ncbi:MAG: hypothetical protein L0206_16260 [Actinobacteria bacterium]|nr:hypothetical protein [Actinomycetota bacterium]
MGERVLVTIELRFATEDDPEQLGERVRESASLIVGRDALEEFRVRVMPLTPPKKPRNPRSV